MLGCRKLILRMMAPVVAGGLALAPAFAWEDATVSVYLGYSSAVNAVSLSPGGRQALSGGQDNVLRLWDTATGLLVRTFDAQTDNIDAVGFSPDGRQVMAAGNGKQIRVWDIASGQLVRTLEGHTDAVLSAVFLANGRQILSGSRDKTVKLWDVETGQAVKSFEGHTEEVLSVAVQADGRRALSASKDRTLKLWDVETGQPLRTFEGHAGEVTAAALAPDGSRALSGSRDKTLKLWDAGTGRLLKTFEGHSDEVLTAAFLSKGHSILSAGKDRTLKLWDADNGELLKTFEGHSDAVASAAVAPDGRRALSGSADKTLKFWDLEERRLLSSIDIPSVKFSPNGHRGYGLFGVLAGTTLPGAPDTSRLGERLKEKGFISGDPVFLRIFKADVQAELWMKRGRRFELFATYPICAWSGQLGPKLREGDSQSPEGFYTISKSQLNPNSKYFRAFNLGFPNLFDAANGRTGSALMVHGSCASVGCYAMTDPVIGELWQLAGAALDRGQERVGVHVFPFRMTPDRMAAFDWHPSAEFWRDLKSAYDFFEETRIPPLIGVCNKRYAVKPGSADTGSAPALQAACPPRNPEASRLTGGVAPALALEGRP